MANFDKPDFSNYQFRIYLIIETKTVEQTLGEGGFGRSVTGNDIVLFKVGRNSVDVVRLIALRRHLRQLLIEVVQSGRRRDPEKGKSRREDCEEREANTVTSYP